LVRSAFHDAMSSYICTLSLHDALPIFTRVVAVRNVSVRELSPLLRQLIDNAGAGNVVHYDPANIILITGRAAVVNRLAEIIKRVDRKSTRLNSSHVKISYAVFCLK